MAEASATAGYRSDLAYVHDAGFGQVAEAAAGTLVGLLEARGARRGLVVELGCGSGILSARLSASGYDVLGYDISPDMVALARRRAPRGTFRCAALLDVEVPECLAVAAVGEVFNYRFDRRHSPARLEQVFRRVHAALGPGGVFLFDAALVGRAGGGVRRGATLGNDWACLYEARESVAQKALIRRITTFRRAGRAYRRSDEVHRLRLFEREELLTPLARVGFRVRTVRRYGALQFPPGYLGFLAKKASETS